MALNTGLTLKALLENPELLKSPKINDDARHKKGLESPPTYAGQSAYLGPNLWDKTLPYDVTGDLKDFKLEYMDLDEFFQENDIFDDLFTNSPKPGVQAGMSPQRQHISTIQQSQTAPSTGLTTGPGLRAEAEMRMRAASRNSTMYSTSSQDSVGMNTFRQRPDCAESSSPSASPASVKVDFELEDSDLAMASVPGEEEFDPRRKRFSDEELRPQPMIKKSRKVYVPEDLKDDKYWNRRSKNNVAAKRSRDARRIKENQIALRASYLERENSTLKGELKKALAEADQLRRKLSKYEQNP